MNPEVQPEFAILISRLYNPAQTPNMRPHQCCLSTPVGGTPAQQTHHGGTRTTSSGNRLSASRLPPLVVPRGRAAGITGAGDLLIWSPSGPKYKAQTGVGMNYQSIARGGIGQITAKRDFGVRHAAQTGRTRQERPRAVPDGDRACLTIIDTAQAN
jgi:hypothetical protein